MWAILRRALAAVGALALLAACGGSPASTPSSARPPRSSHGPGAITTSPAPAGSPSSAPTPPISDGPTSVPPPVPGNISETIASRTAPPPQQVGLDTAVRFRKVALSAAVADPARVQAQAHIPGEIAGPALSFTLQLTNRGKVSLDLDTNIAVTAQDAAGAPFTALTTSTHPVSGTLRAGGHASGRYVFHLPDNTKNPVTIEVTYAATAEVAHFVGPIS